MNSQDLLDTSVTFNPTENSFTTSTGTGDNTFMDYGGYYDLYQPYIERNYPIYYPIYQNNPNKTEIAFNIVAKLIKKELIKKITIKKFIELVNIVSKEII